MGRNLGQIGGGGGGGNRATFLPVDSYRRKIGQQASKIDRKLHKAESRREAVNVERTSAVRQLWVPLVLLLVALATVYLLIYVIVHGHLASVRVWTDMVFVWFNDQVMVPMLVVGSKQYGYLLQIVAGIDVLLFVAFVVHNFMHRN